MKKEEKQILKLLIENKDYEQIFRQFGQKEFLKSVDRKYKEQDIEKLIAKGKFEDIYLRYGEKTYNKYLRKFKQREIEEIYGKRSIQAIIGRMKLVGVAMLTGFGIEITRYGIKEYVQPTLVDAKATIQNAEDYREESEKEYKEELQEYEEAIQEYAEYINKLNLTDIETIMKVQEDMWATIEGYDDPEIDIEACFGLDIWFTKKGVCRNMADDVARKLNAINPKYNARICSVKTETSVNGEIPDINRVIFELDETNQKLQYSGLKIYLPNYINYEDALDSNHNIVLVDIPEDNLTLIVDPTNTVLGVLKNGKINILNVIPEQQSSIMERKPWTDLFYRDNISIYDIPKEYAKSFLPTEISKEEIEEKYGLEAQNNALYSANRKEQEYIYQLSENENSFKSSLQVNSKDDIYSVEEIKNSYENWMEKLGGNITNEEFSEIIKDVGKWYDSIQYYNNKKEELLGTQILNSKMLLQAKLGIDLQTFAKKLNDSRLAIEYTKSYEYGTSSIVTTQDKVENERQEDLEEEL